MIATQRYETIIQLVNERGIINTRELALILHVTETTIRRDCETLEKKGALIRVHGGAKSIRSRDILSSYDDKKMNERTEHYVEKENICKRAASLVQEGDCIYLDGGTTMVGMLKYLKGKRIKIVTSSALIANAFTDEEAELFLVGGQFLVGYDMAVGPIALTYLRRFNFDHAFLGCTGLDLEKDCIYTTEIETMSIKEVVMEQAVKKYLLMDSSKFFIKGFYGLLKGSDFDAIICNRDALVDTKALPDHFIVVDYK